MSLVRAVYTTAIRLATPAILLHLARRTRRQTGTCDDWRARLGYGPRVEGGAIWIHAASAGEIQAAAPLVAALRTEHPLRLTCFTASGRARADRLLPGVDAELAPLDLPGAWRRFFVRGRPRVVVLVESELWPNLLAAARRAGVPVVLASARLTPGSARRLARVPGVARELLGGLAQVLVQTSADLERFVALGLP
ncbi:MAG: 3-deoxy-D-manno-octulosonic acid transferase, partial [Gammaproteobacteria bacterium]